MPQPLPRYHRHQQEADDLRRIARILLETGEALPEEIRGKPLRASADGHRDDRRRGLPIIGRGTTGAIPGSNPLAAVIAKEARRRRH